MASGGGNAPSEDALLSQLYADGFEAAEKSAAAKKAKNYAEACALLKEAVQFFLEAADIEPDKRKTELLKAKTLDFVRDIADLNTLAKALSQTAMASGSDSLRIARTADFYLESALGQDENDMPSEALMLYEQAAGFYLDAAKSAGNAGDEEACRLYRTRVGGILSRAEKIKQEVLMGVGESTSASDNAPAPVSVPKLPEVSSEPPSYNDIQASSAVVPPPPSPQPSQTPVAAGGSKLSDTEIAVLKRSSTINGRIFQPWLGRIDLCEKYTFPEPFKDPDGTLKLSASQKKHFHRWSRPSEWASSPTLISLISPYGIQQSVIEDCSFVSSLCITASYERRFKKKLITKIIYPQNRAGDPVYNPCGKYMVKLWYNGVARKVIVDDRFPCDKRGGRLCSTSTNPNELWVSIIEKAYMKLNGGYEFGGSNSGIDLYALTGWIPESFHIKKDGFDRDRTWTRLVNAHKFGDCLITVATGEKLDKAEADRIGLVTGHAYAVLDAREVQGLKLLLVKNPWAHVRWKGPFSPGDTKNWTPALRKALSYDQVGHMQMDNGIFWIDYGSLLVYYDTIFLNWNRDLFKYKYGMHGLWPGHRGPKNDQYSLAYNPQYSLSVSVPTDTKKASPVWVLLSRHTNNREDVFEKEYVTLHLYKTNHPMTRVFYPAKPLVRGTYSNNPHYLARFDIPPVSGATTQSYTLVVSQYEKLRDICFTVDVFSTARFKMRNIPVNYGHERKMKGEWKSPGPIVRELELLVATKVRLQLQAPKDVAVNITIRNQSGGGSVATSGDFRRGYCVLESAGELTAGKFNILLSAWENQLGPFFFTVDTVDAGYKLDGI